MINWYVLEAAVTTLFELLAEVISVIVICISVPAAIGSVVLLALSWKEMNAVDEEDGKTSKVRKYILIIILCLLLYFLAHNKLYNHKL
jgi:uncharacterized membrane-anchored protein